MARFNPWTKFEILGGQITSFEILLNESIQNMYQAPSKCLNKWIKVDKLDYLKNDHTIWKIIIILGSNENLGRLEAKLESAYSFMLKYSRLKVWTKSIAWLDITR